MKQSEQRRGLLHVALSRRAGPLKGARPPPQAAPAAASRGTPAPSPLPRAAARNAASLTDGRPPASQRMAAAAGPPAPRGAKQRRGVPGARPKAVDRQSSRLGWTSKTAALPQAQSSPAAARRGAAAGNPHVAMGARPPRSNGGHSPLGNGPLSRAQRAAPEARGARLWGAPAQGRPSPGSPGLRVTRVTRRAGRPCGSRHRSPSARKRP